jgi:rhodanese-related sulfurtransferase
MDELIRNMTGKTTSEMKVSPDQFIDLYNKNEAILLDIRYPFETACWGTKIALEIPLTELPDRLDKIPSDKLIVCTCPDNFRSNIACMYLQSKGVYAKMLFGGLLELAARLKGGGAKDLHLKN